MENINPIHFNGRYFELDKVPDIYNEAYRKRATDLLMKQVEKEIHSLINTDNITCPQDLVERYWKEIKEDENYRIEYILRFLISKPIKGKITKEKCEKRNISLIQIQDPEFYYSPIIDDNGNHIELQFSQDIEDKYKIWKINKMSQKDKPEDPISRLIKQLKQQTKWIWILNLLLFIMLLISVIYIILVK